MKLIATVCPERRGCGVRPNWRLLALLAFAICQPAGADTSESIKERKLRWYEWYVTSVQACVARPDCLTLTARVLQDGLRCADGDGPSCGRAQSNIAEIAALNAATPANPVEPLQTTQACLQMVARDFASRCPTCDPSMAMQAIRQLQQALCGLSGIDRR